MEFTTLNIKFTFIHDMDKLSIYAENLINKNEYEGFITGDSIKKNICIHTIDLLYKEIHTHFSDKIVVELPSNYKNNITIRVEEYHGHRFLKYITIILYPKHFEDKSNEQILDLSTQKNINTNSYLNDYFIPIVNSDNTLKYISRKLNGIYLNNSYFKIGNVKVDNNVMIMNNLTKIVSHNGLSILDQLTPLFEEIKYLNIVGDNYMLDDILQNMRNISTIRLKNISQPLDLSNLTFTSVESLYLIDCPKLYNITSLEQIKTLKLVKCSGNTNIHTFNKNINFEFIYSENKNKVISSENKNIPVCDILLAYIFIGIPIWFIYCLLCTLL